MKKPAYIFLAFAVLSTLTACSNSQSSNDSSSSTESSSSTTTSTESSTTSTFEESSIPEESSATSSVEIIFPPQEKYPEEFTGFVGETLYGADAEQYDDYCEFDGFAYVRWATPVFDNTLDNPDLINWDTYEMPKYAHNIIQTDPKWFVVKTGDVLENGLVVKSASCIFKGDVTTDGTKHTILPRTSVEFENTLTLTGILYCQAENIGYNEDGELFFFADSTENTKIPVIDYDFSSGTHYLLSKWLDPDSGLALVYDGSSFKVGSLDDVSVDLSGIIRKGEFCKVKVTLDNIRLYAMEYTDATSAYGDIVSIERID